MKLFRSLNVNLENVTPDQFAFLCEVLQDDTNNQLKRLKRIRWIAETGFKRTRDYKYDAMLMDILVAIEDLQKFQEHLSLQRTTFVLPIDKNSNLLYEYNKVLLIKLFLSVMHSSQILAKYNED